jgi:hypothetical protein
MVSQKAPRVQIGDRFIKAGDTYGRIWEVMRLWTTGDGILHARVRNNGQKDETRIISTSALIDRNFYSPAPPNPHPDQEGGGSDV